MTVSPEYGQLPQAPELKLCIARTGGPIPAGGATERNLCPDQEQPLAPATVLGRMGSPNHVYLRHQDEARTRRAGSHRDSSAWQGWPGWLLVRYSSGVSRSCSEDRRFNPSSPQH